MEIDILNLKQENLELKQEVSNWKDRYYDSQNTIK
jgi:hypothetical protein